MLARWIILLLLLFSSHLLSAQIDRATFQHMAPEKKFAFMDEYLTQHWWEFYDTFGLPAPQPARLADYRFMQSVAKEPQKQLFPSGFLVPESADC